MPIILDPNSVNSTMRFITDLRGQRIQDKQFADDLAFRKSALDVQSQDNREARASSEAIANEGYASAERISAAGHEVDRERIKAVSQTAREVNATAQFQAETIRRETEAAIERQFGADQKQHFNDLVDNAKIHSEQLNATVVELTQEAQINGAKTKAEVNDYILSTPRGQQVMKDFSDIQSRVIGLREQIHGRFSNRTEQLGENGGTSGPTAVVPLPNGAAIAKGGEDGKPAAILTANGRNGGTLNGGDDLVVIKPTDVPMALGSALSQSGAPPQYMQSNLAEAIARNEPLTPIQEAQIGQKTWTQANDEALAAIERDPDSRAPNPQKNPAVYGITQEQIQQMYGESREAAPPASNAIAAQYGVVDQTPIDPASYEGRVRARQAKESAGFRMFGSASAPENAYFETPKATPKEVGGYADVAGQAPGWSSRGVGSALVNMQQASGQIDAEGAAVKRMGLTTNRNYSADPRERQLQLDSEAKQLMQDRVLNTTKDYRDHAEKQVAAAAQEAASEAFGVEDPADIARASRAFKRNTGVELIDSRTRQITPQAVKIITKAYMKNPDGIAEKAGFAPGELPLRFADMTAHQRKLVAHAAISNLSPMSGLRRGLQEGVDVVRNAPVINWFTDTSSGSKLMSPYANKEGSTIPSAPILLNKRE